MKKVVQLKLLGVDAINLACERLNNGSVIALPTDTLYGLAAKVFCTNAIDNIYSIKRRPQVKPLAICVSNIEEIHQIADTSKVRPGLLHKLFPGPVTVILPRSSSLPRFINPGIKTIGIRIPQNSFIQEVTRRVGPLLLTSANKSGHKSPIEIADFKDIWNDIDLVFDQGSLTDTRDDRELGSTVVEIKSIHHFYIIRDGCASEFVRNTLTDRGYEEISLMKEGDKKITDEHII